MNRMGLNKLNNKEGLTHQKRGKQELKDYNFIPCHDAIAEPKVKTLISPFHCDTAEFRTLLTKKPLHYWIPPAVSIQDNYLINTQLMSSPISLSLSLSHTQTHTH